MPPLDRPAALDTSPMPTAWVVHQAIRSSYNPRRVLDSVPLVKLPFRLASAEATRRVRSEYNRLRNTFLEQAKEEALERWGTVVPKDVILKLMPVESYEIHHKHLVSLGGGNDTLVYLPGDVHTDLHRRHNLITNKVRKTVYENVHGSREHRLSLEMKLEKLETVGISEGLMHKLRTIKGVTVSDNKIWVDTHWPEGSVLIPQLMPFSPHQPTLAKPAPSHQPPQLRAA